MRLLDSIKRSLRTLSHAKIRTFLTVAALAVGGFTLSATLAAANGARAYGNQLVNTNFDPSSIIVTKSQKTFGNNGSTDSPQLYTGNQTSNGFNSLVSELTASDIQKLAELPGVKSVFLPYTTALLYVTRPGYDKYTASSEALNTNITNDFQSGGIGSGLTANQVVLPEDYLSLFGFSSAQKAIGQNIDIAIQPIRGGLITMTLQIVAINQTASTFIGPSNNTKLFVSEALAQQISNDENYGTINYQKYTTATVIVNNGTNQNVLNSVENSIKALGYGAETAKNAQATINQIVNTLQIVIIVFGLITLVASFFGVVNTQYISVLERTREIGLMKALGMSKRAIKRLFIIEAALIGFIGALSGSILAIIVGTLLNPWISKQIGFGSDRLIVFNYSQIAGLIIFLVVVAIIAGLLPARKAARLDPIEALRTE